MITLKLKRKQADILRKALAAYYSSLQKEQHMDYMCNEKGSRNWSKEFDSLSNVTEIVKAALVLNERKHHNQEEVDQ
jgi:hypothetical protein